MNFDDLGKTRFIEMEIKLIIAELIVYNPHRVIEKHNFTRLLKMF